MSTIKAFKGSQLLIKIEDPAVPGVFLHYCTVNAERGIEMTAAFFEDIEEDCDDLTVVGWIDREKESLSMSIDGGGKVNTPDVLFFFNWYKSTDSYNCQVVLDIPAVDGGLIFEGAFHLATFGIRADSRRAKSQGSVSLLSDGEVTASPNA